MTESMSDQASRDLILNNLDENFLVEAAAGTGKTTSIIGRLVNLIARGKCRIESLVAVTFTRKAAAELRERFHSKMRMEANSTRPADEIERLNQALSRMDQAFVGTFHSFCSVILRERPIECGVDPGFRELDEAENISIREQAWQAFLNELYSKEDNRLDRIHELGLATDNLKHCFNRFIEFPDVHQWPHAAPNPIDIEAVKTQVREYIEHMRSLSPAFPTQRESDKLMNRYEAIVRASDNADWRVTGQFFDLLELFDTSHGATLKWWPDKAVAKRERDRFIDFQESVAQPNLDWWYRHRYEFVIELLEQAKCIYDRLRRASGGLDFQDLLIRTAEALQSQPGLRNYFQRRFTHLLVDEFQDTDPIQAEILAYLSATDFEEQTWQQCVPRPGSLFLVGDPKQSIYRFRRADIVTYKQVKKIFQATGGRIVSLAKNFRSNPDLHEWINPVFADRFGYDEDDYSPAAVDLELGRENAVKGSLSGIQVLSFPDGLKQPEAVAAEAELIARYIHNSIASGQTIDRTQREIDCGLPTTVEPGDFLIVAPNKKHLHVYSEALDRLGIKNEVTGSRAFQNIEELKLMRDCLHAVDDPRDPVAYVNVLRGTLFGFGDADLFELKQSGGWLSFTNPVPAELDPELRMRFESVNDRLSTYQRWLRNKPFTAALSNIASDLGLIARCGVRADGDVVAGGFLKAIEWLRAKSWDFDSATDVVTFLDELMTSSETDSCSVLPRSGSHVRIMNLHKVKGLEAPVVFLANTFGAFAHEPEFHVDRSEATTRGYLAITKPKGEWATRPMATPANWEHFKNQESQFEAAERDRLLYVACTRAGCQLVVTKADGRQKKSSHWNPLYPYLENQSELEIPQTSATTSPDVGRAPIKSFTETAGRIIESWNAVKQPTYEVVAAKSVAMKDSKPTWRASGDYGAEWGSVIHRLLEVRMQRPAADMASLAVQISAQFELGAQRIDELIEAVESVAASDIWKRARQAKQVYSEIPFETCQADSGHVPTLTRGVIDLCFEEPAGWVIVDYKTDGISETDIQAAVNFYAPQLKSYAEFWNSITSHPVVETGIYLTKTHSYHPT